MEADELVDEKSLQILRILNNEPLQPTRIVEEVDFSESIVYRRLDKLRKWKLIREIASLTDKRKPIKLYTLTPTGKRVLELLEEIERVLQEGYGEDHEIKEMEEELKKI